MPGSRPAVGPHSAGRALLKGLILHKASSSSPSSPSFPPAPIISPLPPTPIRPPGCHSTPPPPSCHFIPPSSRFIPLLPLHPPAPRCPSSGWSWRGAGGAVCRDSTKRLLCPCQDMRGAGAQPGPAGPSSGATLCPLSPTSARPGAAGGALRAGQLPWGFGELCPIGAVASAAACSRAWPEHRQLALLSCRKDFGA